MGPLQRCTLALRRSYDNQETATNFLRKLAQEYQETQSVKVISGEAAEEPVNSTDEMPVKPVASTNTQRVQAAKGKPKEQ